MIKKLIAVIGVAVLAIAFTQDATAQRAVVVPAVGLTNNVPAATTNDALTVDMTTLKADAAGNVALHYKAKLAAAGTTGINLKFKTTANGVDFPTGATPGFTWTITPAGTLTQTYNTNVTVGAATALRLWGIENPNAGALTNTSLSITIRQQ